MLHRRWLFLLLVVSASSCSPQSVAPPGAPATNAPSLLRAAAAPSITGTYTHDITSAAAIDGIATGYDKRLWFAEFNVSKIGAITTAGVVTEYPTAPNAQPLAVKYALGYIWTGGFGGTLIRTNSTGSQGDYIASGAHIAAIVFDPHKTGWFTDYGNKTLDHLNANSTVSEFSIASKANPIGLTLGPDGNLWLCDAGNAKIVTMNTNGNVLATYGGLGANEYPQYIIAAPDGNFYFSATSFGKSVDEVARITTAGKVTVLSTFPKGSYPQQFAVGKDGNVYFTLANMKALGEIVLSTGKVTTTPLAFKNDNGTQGITAGPDGRLWMTAFQTIYAISY